MCSSGVFVEHLCWALADVEDVIPQRGGRLDIGVGPGNLITALNSVYYFAVTY